jgi:hypothetical protein
MTEARPRAQQRPLASSLRPPPGFEIQRVKRVTNGLTAEGGAVAGGRVLSIRPGLDPGQLYDKQALRVTIGYRDILAEVVAQRWGDQQLDVVFPGDTPTFRDAVV